ncbi:ArsR/SmtB family transcription factor [Ornithinimicrobium murale]|uniref:ArsR/SmtB family transcription factor n=1 Tax=Ornithinimicrobium murale TaxID=1050153 RepID=UPI000E0CF01F|nr:metalloregulator ArsR/SmtB family transcription factor [Ornithinimicrobium murale]
MSTSVFRAVADPHRRQLLDALREQGDQSLGTLCHGLPITRQAASKHLAVLEDAGLVRVRTDGRQRLHSLDAQPLADLAAWLATYSTFWTERLDTLEDRLLQETRATRDDYSHD